MTDKPIQDAPAPFSGISDSDDHPYPSDFILRSCDGVDFHVHREILKFGSACFEGMFTTVRNGVDKPSRDGKPVLSLPETNAVLTKLLTLAYPAHTAGGYTLTVADLDIFVDVYQAAHKYQFSLVEGLLGEILDNPFLLGAHPYRLFAIARVCQLPHIARKAALCTLESVLIPAPPEFPEMHLLTWADARKLFEFHQLCGKTAHDTAQNATKSINAGMTSIPFTQIRRRTDHLCGGA
ncbi:hypothetical protein DFH07DRAFT_592274 [Mycena maculata]|uniref:BTB domain-containing protein n=1 Tax=Mycena maculata TaxID=230809 RepID=A0AAD7N4I4_9AGAR|nr:hypothetical protein DFH07DRAFT_592274 [Mycena maculata]